MVTLLRLLQRGGFKCYFQVREFNLLVEKHMLNILEILPKNFSTNKKLNIIYPYFLLIE